MFDLNAAVSLFNAQIQRSNNFWTAFSVVSFAMIGVVLSKAPDQVVGRIRFAASVLFTMFAIQNSQALYETHQLLADITCAIRTDVGVDCKTLAPLGGRGARKAAHFDAVLIQLDAASPSQVRSYHFLLWLGVILFLWLPVFKPRFRNWYAAREQTESTADETASK